MISRTAIATKLYTTGAILLMITAVCGCWSSQTKPEQTVVGTEKVIREHLLVGSSRSDVGAYLDKRGIEHSHIGDGTEIAVIRGGAKYAVVKTDIRVVFKFDDTDTKLVSYSVGEHLTGP